MLNLSASPGEILFLFPSARMYSQAAATPSKEPKIPPNIKAFL